MPPKNCAACTKLVFPVEELKCLDKTWHKACFKCQVCNMTLNMKNYKGYDKMPYCGAHYPETKFTVVADTPENQRLAANSKIQSNVKYHEEFEKSKGQYTAVADDPETMRVRKNMETISNAMYHNDAARRQDMEGNRGYSVDDDYPSSYQAPPTRPPVPSQSQMAPPSLGYSYTGTSSGGPPGGRKPGSISDYDPTTGRGHEGSPYTSKTQSTTVYSSSSQPSQPQAYKPQQQSYDSQRQSYTQQITSPQQPYPQTPSYQPQAQPAQYNSRMQQAAPIPQMNLQYQQANPQPQMNSQYQQANPQPQMNSQYQQANPQMNSQYQQTAQVQMRPPQSSQMPQRTSGPPPQARDPYYGKGCVSRALYDYSAADTDEVSFADGDFIVKCEPIDDGWMMGTVERTGRHGMLPSNYVERLNW